MPLKKKAASERPAAKVKIQPYMNTTKTDAAHWHSMSCDAALALLDLQSRTCVAERLLYSWVPDGEGRIARPIRRPTAGNRLVSPNRNLISAPVICLSDDVDAHYLARHLHNPFDHVGELHRLLKRALSGRVGHLSPGDMRIMQGPSAGWPGFHMRTRREMVDVAFRFAGAELSAIETRPVVETALRIVRLAQEHIARCEATRLAVANGQPLPLDRSFKSLPQEDWPRWWTIEPPGHANEAWRDRPVERRA
jgi:hypothetical protein